MHTTLDRGVAVAAVDHLEMDPIGNKINVRFVLAYYSGVAIFCILFQLRKRPLLGSGN